MLPKTLKNFVAFVDGVGYAGRVTEGTPPKLIAKVEEYIAGGMTAPVDLDMGTVEKMECEIVLAEFNADVIKKFGSDDVPVTLRGAQGPDAEPVIVDMRGLMREIDQGAFKSPEKNTMKIAVTVGYYKLSIGGAELIEIDAVNMKYVVAGVDRMAKMRTALGL